MIGIYKEEISSIPCLTVVDTDNIKAPLPLIVYFHGFTSAKEHNLDLAYLLAEEGFRVVLPDSLHHGERKEGLSQLEITMAFWNIVMQNVGELFLIKEYFQERQLILDGKIGVAGTSMGGITTSAALRKYDWVKSAAVLMGSPKLKEFASALINNYKEMMSLPITDEIIEALYNQIKEYDLSLQTEMLNNRPLLFWHGDKDPVVPFDHSFSFYEKAKNLYDNPEDIRFIREKGQGHKVSREAKLETTQWFKKHLVEDILT